MDPSLPFGLGPHRCGWPGHASGTLRGEPSKTAAHFAVGGNAGLCDLEMRGCFRFAANLKTRLFDPKWRGGQALVGERVQGWSMVLKAQHHGQHRQQHLGVVGTFLRSIPDPPNLELGRLIHSG